jgi:uncharacterized protein YyaL (SSP411 family)
LKRRLLEARQRRVRPGRDDKVLTDWNGLAIQALAEAGRAFDRPDWIAAAADAFDRIDRAASNGRLPHSVLGDKGLFPALSSDYAAMVAAAVALRQATGQGAYIDKARHYLNQLDRWHGDEENAGYYLTASDSADVPLRIRGDVDEAIPSATAQIIEATARLATLTGDMDMEEKVRRVAEHAMGRAAQQAYGQAGIVNACALTLDSRRLVIIENPDKPRLVAVANRNPDPRRIDIPVPLGADDPPELPGGVLPPTDKPGAYLCMGQICLPAITDAGELERQLRRAPVNRG